MREKFLRDKSERQLKLRMKIYRKESDARLLASQQQFSTATAHKTDAIL